MVTLNRVVKRVSNATVREAGKARNIVVVLRAPGIIGLRAAGCRREYQLPLEAIYAMAVRAHVADMKKQKAKKKET